MNLNRFFVRCSCGKELRSYKNVVCQHRIVDVYMFSYLLSLVLRFDGGGVGGVSSFADNNRCWRSRSRRALCAIERVLPVPGGSDRGVLLLADRSPC